MRRKIFILLAALTCMAINAQAQDFLGGFAPTSSQTQKDGSQKKSSKSGKKSSTKKESQKVSLPDKPNVTDSQGRKQGEWAKKYPNGRYRYTATFKNDKPVGKVTRYDEKGRKTVVLTYKESTDTVKMTGYHPNGKVSCRGQYVKGKREGFWRFYGDDGVLVESASYNKDKLHSKRCFYYDNGNLLSVCTWVDSLREGPYVKYFIGGAKMIETTFHLDELDGKYTSWGADGKISSQGKYKQGVMVGKWHIHYAGTNVEGDIEYDSHGLPVDPDAALELQQRRNQYYEKNKGNIQDPEDFMNNPETLIFGNAPSF